ncbi:hypothetical protein AVEN_90168-1 [Araneus ventricosus]|uniref:Uncharacterized protein n=1 Tax=Araneus ventricosus TaxID=182803 RepID=A0A4Y2H9A4_ARAVE|nr:hypothetical protein AVEN_90168-1 [Araneus ventricosus]
MTRAPFTLAKSLMTTRGEKNPFSPSATYPHYATVNICAKFEENLKTRLIVTASQTNLWAKRRNAQRLSRTSLRSVKPAEVVSPKHSRIRPNGGGGEIHRAAVTWRIP